MKNIVGHAISIAFLATQAFPSLGETAGNSPFVDTVGESDVAGIGKYGGFNGEHFTRIDDIVYWFGDPGTNSIVLTPLDGWTGSCSFKLTSKPTTRSFSSESGRGGIRFRPILFFVQSTDPLGNGGKSGCRQEQPDRLRIHPTSFPARGSTSRRVRRRRSASSLTSCIRSASRRI